MTDSNIVKLISGLTKSLVTKADINEVKQDVKNLDAKVDKGFKSLERKIDELDKKADTIMQFAHEVDETVTDHEKRLKRIETTVISS